MEENGKIIITPEIFTQIAPMVKVFVINTWHVDDIYCLLNFKNFFVTTWNIKKILTQTHYMVFKIDRYFKIIIIELKFKLGCCNLYYMC